MCKIVGRGGTASLVVIPGLEDIARKPEGGARNSPPPVGRGLKFNASIYHISCAGVLRYVLYKWSERDA